MNSLFPGASGIYFELHKFEYFTVSHLVTISIAFAVLVALFFVFRGKKSWFKPVMISLSVAIFACFAALGVYSAVTGDYNFEWYLPFHICNLFVVMLPLSCFVKGRLLSAVKNYMVFFGFGGCLLQTVFPMNTALFYPAYHFVPVVVAAHHCIIGVAAVYLVASGSFKKFNAFGIIIPLVFLVTGAALANYFTGLNFLFLNYSFDLFPVNIFYNFFGETAVYFIAFNVLAAAVTTQVCINKIKYRRQPFTRRHKMRLF